MSFTSKDIKVLQQLFEQQNQKIEKKILGLRQQNQRIGKDIKVLQNQDLGLSNELVAFEDRLSEKISHLPTKEEFFGRMDTICVELKTIREEQIVMKHQIDEHSDAIAQLQLAL